MPKAKQDKYGLLASVIDAIYDMNNKVVVETVNDGRYNDEPKIPSSRSQRWGPHSENWARAQSVKVGKNVSIKRIPVEKSRAKLAGKGVLNYSCTYVVRTPDGEAEFTNSDLDFKQVWYAALGRYDIERDGYGSMFNVMKVMYKNVQNPKLKEAAGKGITMKNDKKSKYEAAIEHLKQLGIQPKNLAKYIQDKQNS